MRKYFRCGDQNHLFGECLKPPRDKNQWAFLRGSWSDGGEEDDEKDKDETCLMAQASSEICLGIDLEPKSRSKIVNELVRSLPKLKFDQRFCDAYKIRKQAHTSHKAKNIVSTTRCLELLHMDLFGPSTVWSYRRNLYTLVIVDDYSRKPTLDYFKVFRSKCFILRTKFYLTKFDPKSYEDVFLGYSQNSKACIILNKHTMKIKEALNMTFDETPKPSKTSPLVDDDLDEEEAIKVTKKKNLENDIVDETLKVDEIVNIKESKNHPLENVIENINQRTLRSQAQNQGLWYPKGTGIETIVYADSDHAGDYVDQKSTSSICTFVGCCLTSWFSKKQTALAISTIEMEYVSTGKACQQALWMKQDLIDYDIRLDDLSIMCDNKGAIDLSKNLVQHSWTKHIKIRHHFLWDSVQKGNIPIEIFLSEDNIANILTKPLKRESFNYRRLCLGMMERIL
nr:copia protein [Tanacetum cinerariifolium]